MRFNLYSTFRLAVKAKSVDLDVPGPVTLLDAVHRLLEEHPALHSAWLREDGEIQPHIHFFVNGQDLRSLDTRMQTMLAAQDVIDCFPSVSGGS